MGFITGFQTYVQVSCLYFRLLFNNGTFTNNTGVEVRTPGFGNTTTIEQLDGGIKAVAYDGAGD